MNTSVELLAGVDFPMLNTIELHQGTEIIQRGIKLERCPEETRWPLFVSALVAHCMLCFPSSVARACAWSHPLYD